MLNYIDDFGGIAGNHDTATLHFHMLQTLLRSLGLKEAAHKASPPAEAMTWLGLRFDTVEMTVTIPPEKLQDTVRLVEDWVGRQAGRQPTYTNFRHSSESCHTYPSAVNLPGCSSIIC